MNLKDLRKNTKEELIIYIEKLSREFVKKNIAVVNQFPYIFNLSIRDN